MLGYCKTDSDKPKNKISNLEIRLKESLLPVKHSMNIWLYLTENQMKTVMKNVAGELRNIRSDNYFQQRQIALRIPVVQ